jgi:hypothetical protein
MIKLSLATLTSEAFREAFKKLIEAELPIQAAYKCTAIAREIDTHVKDYSTVRNKTLSKYAKKDESGKLVLENGSPVFEQDKLLEFRREMAELNACMVEISTISIQECGDKAEIKAAEIMALEGVIAP